jgi:hypothetical protein
MAKDDEQQESRGFKVQDRRRFVDSEERSDDPASETTRAADAQEKDARGESVAARDASFAAGAASADATLGPEHAAGDAAAFGEMSFSTFVMGLTTQALMHLGEIPDPMDQRVTHDLPAAKQMIDLLGILRDKTKGNLDAAEEQLLGEVLYDLRMRYVEMSRSR